MTAPASIDCKEAAARLYEYLDGELTPERDAEVRAHIAACPHCFALYGFEGTYLRFLEARTRSVGAPDHLRHRILDALLHDGDSPPA